MQTVYLKNATRGRLPSQLASVVLILLGASGCTDIQSPKKTEYRGSETSPAAKFDPSKASVSVELKTEPMKGYPKGNVPALSLALANSNYTEVFRCGASYELKYGNGLQKLTDVPESDPSYSEYAKDAFARMRTHGSDCVRVGVGNSLNIVRDYGAQSGNFYYIVNPCVTSEQSTTSRHDCSYQLAITKPIQYTNTRAQAEVDILSTFLDAEGALYAHFKEMEALTVSITAIETTCVLDEADRQLVAARSQALMGIVKTVATTVINGLAPGVGTALGAVVDALGKLKAAGAQPNIGSTCPQAVTKMERYKELEGQVNTIATRVIEARKELHHLDSTYADVTKELNELKQKLAN